MHTDSLCLFVSLFWFLGPSQQVFSHDRTGLSVLNHTIKQRIKCLAQRHNEVPTVRLEPATPQSRVQHSTTEPPHFSRQFLLKLMSLPHGAMGSDLWSVVTFSWSYSLGFWLKKLQLEACYRFSMMDKVSGYLWWVRTIPCIYLCKSNKHPITLTWYY